jgi:hypothetical protein
MQTLDSDSTANCAALASRSLRARRAHCFTLSTRAASSCNKKVGFQNQKQQQKKQHSLQKQHPISVSIAHSHQSKKLQ